MAHPQQPVAALGFTVKSGWACVVLVRGPLASPRVIDSARVELSDPASPESRQPYHDGFGTARASGATLESLLASVRTFGAHSVAAVIARHEGTNQPLSGAGIVVGSLAEPQSIANDHIRIHALEGRLFRGVVERAVSQCGLPYSVWRERDLYAAAAEILHRTEADVRAAVASQKHSVSGPWRAEHKAAATAAWMVLAGRQDVASPARRRSP